MNRLKVLRRNLLRMERAQVKQQLYVTQREQARRTAEEFPIRMGQCAFHYGVWLHTHAVWERTEGLNSSTEGRNMWDMTQPTEGRIPVSSASHLRLRELIAWLQHRGWMQA